MAKAARSAVEEDPERHSQRPYHGYGRVLAQAHAPRQPFYPHRGAYGEHPGHYHGVDAEEITKPEASEAGVGYAARYCHKAPGNDICAYHCGTYAYEEHAGKSLAEKGIVEIFKHWRNEPSVPRPLSL